MKKFTTLKKIGLFLGALFLTLSFSSCSDDDDHETLIPVRRPTGSFDIEEMQIMTGNTIRLENITVGQNSWLVAVNSGEEETNNFIAGPLMLQEGQHSNIQLTFEEGAITEGDTGHLVILKLYEDARNRGASGAWDAQDQPIRAINGELIMAEITVIYEDISPYFAAFDINSDGYLDAVEILATYYNKFSDWDDDGDGSLIHEEFYSTTFANTDADDDDEINEEEWNIGLSGMYAKWSGNDFVAIDTNSDNIIDISEWNAIFNDSGWFEFYDSDSNTSVSEEEWNAGLFGDWDPDDNNLIDETEFSLYRAYTLSWHDDPESYTYGWYDTNNNGILELQEAIETFIFSAWWDVDQNGKLSSEEFFYTIFHNADFYYDENISEEEWDPGYNVLFGKRVEDNFSEFDQNNNGKLNSEEWNTIFQESGWFEDYDTDEDGYVSKAEWNTGLFNDWDIDDNNLINKEEFDSYISYAFSWIKW